MTRTAAPRLRATVSPKRSRSTQGWLPTSATFTCRPAPVGWRACGGPRSYVVYCRASTDTVALLRKLDELKRAEMEYNDREGVVSTCEMRTPPGVTGPPEEAPK